MRNKFRTPQERAPKSSAAVKNNAPAYSLSSQIPDCYNDTYIRAIPRDPVHAFIYWELSGNENIHKHDTQSESGGRYADKHEVIKIQQNPPVGPKPIPPTAPVQFGQTFHTVQAFEDVNHTRSSSRQTVAQINPQSPVGNTYVETQRCGGSIKAEYGVENNSGGNQLQKKSFQILASSPVVQTSEPAVKQLTLTKKGVDTNALLERSSVNLNIILSNGISGISHLSSGNLYNVKAKENS
ncbi:MAG: DUF4912 domain-containing protein [Chitinispirillales bacterium]|nr:DUF4912 domain-containing protein [Chitinispirillales bacterium]